MSSFTSCWFPHTPLPCLLLSLPYLYPVFPLTLCQIVIVSFVCTWASALSSVCLLAWFWTLPGLRTLDFVAFPWMDLFASLTVYPCMKSYILNLIFGLSCFLLHLSPSSVQECHRRNRKRRNRGGSLGWGPGGTSPSWHLIVLSVIYILFLIK